MTEDLRKRIDHSVEAVGWTLEYLENLNAVLRSPKITPLGAYCLGVAEVVVRGELVDTLPSLWLMERVSGCTSVESAKWIAKAWCDDVRRLRETERRKQFPRGGLDDGPPLPKV